MRLLNADILAVNAAKPGLFEKFYQGYKDRHRPLNFWGLAETCIACLYSKQNTNKTTTMLRFGNR